MEPIAGQEAFSSGERSFLTGLRPQDAVALPMRRVIELLRNRIGSAVDAAVSDEALDFDRPTSELPEAVRSPLHGQANTSWMRQTNMVGVNIRTVGDYAGVIKYALTLPRALDSIHLLPIWEPGVVESLYGIASWQLNPEFFSEEWLEMCPQLDTVERQLRAVSNVLHAMGKVVGMDVIPHTDRFSEAAVGSPDLFEWMRVAGDEIVDKSEGLARLVEDAVFQWLDLNGSADPGLGNVPDRSLLFELPEADRLAILFGPPEDRLLRIDRRVSLIRHLKGLGLEPVPATMGVPFRGLEIDPEHVVVDDYGMSWPDLVISRPQPMSRVFSPLARFKLYGRVDDNANWEIDFSRPRSHVWDYVRGHYAQTRHVGNFDFMRGDMSHVQMRRDGVPDLVDDHYDILGAVKTHLRREVPWFGYFAESFLPPRDVFQYGEEMDHLEASLADATLGDLQSTIVGSAEFLQRFRRYLDDLHTRRCAPAFCIGTADKDDPRFDENFEHGLEARFFTALFVADMPSYVGLGYEIRDVHTEPAENERYTKLFVFKEEGNSNVYPSKARFSDDFVWGDNRELFQRVTEMREMADMLLPGIGQSTTHWLIPPDATGLRGTAAWTQVSGVPEYVFVVNYDVEDGSGYFGIPGLSRELTLQALYSTVGDTPAGDEVLRSNGYFHRIEDMAPGECRIYRVKGATDDAVHD